MEEHPGTRIRHPHPGRRGGEGGGRDMTRLESLVPSAELPVCREWLIHMYSKAAKAFELKP